jgi:segregation and condensation protein B
MSETGLVQIIEGALLAAGKALTVAQLGDLFEENERPENADIREALKEIAERCEGRGFELVEVASGFRYQVRQSLSPWVARLWQERPAKYSRALLETLALIAYRQPITRGEIEEIRGVAVSSNIIKTLHEREWIRVVGHRDVPGRPAMYATTRQFLDYFNLKNLDQLPALAEIRDLETLNAELGFTEPLPEELRTAQPKEGDQQGAEGDGPELTVVGGTEHVSGEQPAEQADAAEVDQDTDVAEDASADIAETAQQEPENAEQLAEAFEELTAQASGPAEDLELNEQGDQEVEAAKPESQA